MTAARSAIKTPRRFPIFMRRTIPAEPAESLLQTIHERPALWINPDPWTQKFESRD